VTTSAFVIWTTVRTLHILATVASFRDRLVATIHAAGPVLEKLVTDRRGEKGERDLLVALGLIALAGAGDLDETEALYARLLPDLRHAVRSNLTVVWSRWIEAFSMLRACSS